VHVEKPLLEIEQDILSPRPDRLEGLLRGVGNGHPSLEDARTALMKGIVRARTAFKQGTMSIPELLLSVDAFRNGIGILNRFELAEGRTHGGPSIVVGVVEGDVHDMGKNIVAGVLEASGYIVHDAGRDVPRETFLRLLEDTSAPLLALSSMMSTPLANMRELISWVRRLHPDTGILVGGAALDERLARGLGAQGYAESAAEVPDVVLEVLRLKEKKEDQAVPISGSE